MPMPGSVLESRIQDLVPELERVYKDIHAPVIIVTTSGNCGSLTPIGTPSLATPRT